MTSSYRQTSYSRPLSSHWSINPYCLIHISAPALTTPLLSHWPIRMGHFWRLNAPWPMRGQDLLYLHIMQICPTLPHTKSTDRLPHILLTCNVNLVIDLWRSNITWRKLRHYRVFDTLSADSARYGRPSSSKGCQMLKTVSNNQQGLKCWMKLMPYRVVDLNANFGTFTRNWDLNGILTVTRFDILTNFWGPFQHLTPFAFNIWVLIRYLKPFSAFETLFIQHLRPYW